MFLRCNLIILRFCVLFLFGYKYWYIFIIIEILWIDKRSKIVYDLKLNGKLQQINGNLNLDQMFIVILMNTIKTLQLLMILKVPLRYLKKDNQKESL